MASATGYKYRQSGLTLSVSTPWFFRQTKPMPVNALCSCAASRCFTSSLTLSGDVEMLYSAKSTIGIREVVSSRDNRAEPSSFILLCSVVDHVWWRSLGKAALNKLVSLFILKKNKSNKSV